MLGRGSRTEGKQEEGVGATRQEKVWGGLQLPEFLPIGTSPHHCHHPAPHSGEKEEPMPRQQVAVGYPK